MLTIIMFFKFSIWSLKNCCSFVLISKKQNNLPKLWQNNNDWDFLEACFSHGFIYLLSCLHLTPRFSADIHCYFFIIFCLWLWGSETFFYTVACKAAPRRASSSTMLIIHMFITLISATSAFLDIFWYAFWHLLANSYSIFCPDIFLSDVVFVIKICRLIAFLQALLAQYSQSWRLFCYSAPKSLQSLLGATCLGTQEFKHYSTFP